ncbi:MAG TPA: hypothetical protein VFE02_15970 [Candidatus Acidoferrales bacterium]|jgi:hypothetical protein|nr:hypothetical protein [Candidatus Acidoferrales bacterium]
MLKSNQGAKVENPRAYDPGAVEHLQYLLNVGVPAVRDPKRENFYEIESSSETFYVHVSPVSGNIVLLARWIRQTRECYSDSRHLTARVA